MPENIWLSQYQDSWLSVFENEATLIQRSLPYLQLKIHHIGSTSIPGIKSKPIVDINIESKKFPPCLEIIGELVSIGYNSMGEASVKGRRWFIKGEPRKFNLHWCPWNGAVTLAQLKFRDKLRNDQSLAEQYERIKLEAALGQSIDSSEYADAKSAFIEKVIESV